MMTRYLGNEFYGNVEANVTVNANAHAPLDIAGSGVGGVRVTESGANSYLHADTVTADPPGADCDAPAEAGRMLFRTDTGGLWICKGAAGWVTK
jgi:hypothetical protein